MLGVFKCQVEMTSDPSTWPWRMVRNDRSLINRLAIVFLA
jgi:hypothetical protein